MNDHWMAVILLTKAARGSYGVNLLDWTLARYTQKILQQSGQFLDSQIQTSDLVKWTKCIRNRYVRVYIQTIQSVFRIEQICLADEEIKGRETVPDSTAGFKWYQFNQVNVEC